MKNCPALNCENEIPHSHAFCAEHFRQLPEEYKSALLTAVRTRDWHAMQEATKSANLWMIKERQLKEEVHAASTWYSRESER